MDSERAWKWAERAGPVVIAPLCSLAALYFAAATYYGWDKQAAPPPVIKDDHGWSAMTPAPWLGLALLCIAIVSVLTSWGMIFIRRRAERRRATGQEFIPVGAMGPAPPVMPEGKSASRPYLREARVNAGLRTSSPEIFPNVVVCFGRSGQNADVCVDFSYFAGNFWLQRRRLLLKNIPSFRRDERLAITIISRDIAEHGLIWRWGDAQIKYPNKAEGMLGLNLHYQCRIAFIFADETEEYAYFIVASDASADLMPRVVGNHMFDFVDSWNSQ